MKYLAVWLTLLSFAGNAHAQARPNVLFLITDEHSPHALGCYGNEIIQTPNLDDLAADGTLFPNAYCQNPVCVPSRASLITGMMPSRLGIMGNQDPLIYEATLPRLFKDKGYIVEWFGKEHWGSSNEVLGFGSGNSQFLKEMKAQYLEAKAFRDSVGRLPHDAAAYDFSEENDFEALLANEAVDFLSDLSGSTPFFLGVSLKKPHFPFICNTKYYDLYKEEADVPEVTLAMIDDWSITEKQESDKWGFETMTPEQVRKARAIYYGMVTYIDDQVGKIISELKNLGLYENTIIIYTSDHGEMNGEHGLWYKNSFYDASVSVPYIWSYSKLIESGRIINAPVMIMDILPTLCDLCSLDQPSGLSGTSIASLLACNKEGDNRAAFSETFRNGNHGYMIRKGEWKYCWYAKEDGRLFNMDDDPAEVNNLIHENDSQDIIAQLKKELEAFLDRKLVR